MGAPDIPSLLLAMLRIACTAGIEPIWSRFLGSVSVQLAGTCKSKPQELLPLHGWPNLVLHIQLGQSLTSACPPHLPYHPTNASGQVEDGPICNEPSRHSCADKKDNGQITLQVPILNTTEDKKAAKLIIQERRQLSKNKHWGINSIELMGTTGHLLHKNTSL